MRFKNFKKERKKEIQERAITRKKIEILKPHSSYNTARFKNYWHTMTMDLKKQFLKIQMADLKRHFENGRSATHALDGLKEIKIWKVWHCWCNSHSMFYSENLMMQHILNEHLCTSQNFLRGNNSTELESFYKICKSSEKWGPMDVAAAVKIMEDFSRNEQGDQGQYISTVFMVKFNVLCEILYMLALIAWCPLHTLSTQSDYSCTMPT